MTELERFISRNLSALDKEAGEERCAVEVMMEHEEKKAPHLRSKTFMISCRCRKCKREYLA